MKLYLVHCGFYDLSVCDGVYESHVNLFVVGESFEDARTRVKQLPEFREKRMHVDGLQEIEAVGGFRIQLVEDKGETAHTRLKSHRHRDLAPKPVSEKE